MRYAIEIDDRTKAGKSLVEVVKNMARLYKSIRIDKIDEAKEDKALLSMMEESMESGYADTEEVLKRFGIK